MKSSTPEWTVVDGPGRCSTEAMAFVDEFYQRADAFLFGRRTYDLFAGYWASGTISRTRS